MPAKPTPPAPNLRDAVLEAHEAARKAYEFCPGTFTYHAVSALTKALRFLPPRVDEEEE
jgi:hypothetical protein